MAQSAQEIVCKRREATQELSTQLRVWVDLLSKQKDQAELHYHPSPALLTETPDISAALQVGFEKMRPREQEQGHTLIGPHRDHLSIELSHKSAKQFSSEGQKRSCVAALRFAEWQQMTAVLEEKPLLGIDDFGIQLDAERQQQLHTHLSSFQQIFLTSPTFPQLSGKRFHIDQGEISEG